MQAIFCNGKERIVTLTTEEVLELHDILCKNYDLLPEMEPVSPPGVKNHGMLESAVSRQLVGSGDYYKYADIHSNCATLVFGLVKNHSFHNGNKRIGFLSLIKHLYSNGYVIRANIQHKEIFELLRTMADSSLKAHAEVFHKNFYNRYRKHVWTDEIQIEYVAYWLRRNTEHKNTKIRQKTIPLNDLIRMLKTKDLYSEFTGKFLIVSKKPTFIQELFGKRTYKKEYLIKNGKYVTIASVDQIRRDFEITFLDGVDNSSFFNEEDFLSNEIVAYKKIIYKLAKT